MTRTTRALLACTMMIVTALAAVPAFAASAGWASVDLVLYDDATPLMIVSGQLPQDTQLPADVILTTPAGAQVQWAGEVLGGAIEDDPALIPSTETSGTLDFHSFTMTQGLRGQLEVLAPGAVTVEDGVKTATLSWTAAQDIPIVNAIIRLPVGSQIASSTAGGQLSPGPTGFQFYERAFENVRAGEVVELSLTYTPPAGTAAGGVGAIVDGPSSTADAIVPGLFTLAAIAVAAMLFMGLRRKVGGVGPLESGDEPLAQTSASVEQAHDVEADVPSDANAPEPERRTLPIKLITVVVAGVFVVGAIVAINLGSRPQVSNGTISAQIATVDECTRSTFNLAIPDGTSIEKASEEIFDAMRMTTGIGLVTVYTDDPRVEVGYCESNNNEPAIREVLAATGYLGAP